MSADREQFASVRNALAQIQTLSRVEPNDTIELARAFFPTGHRGVLDMRRQLVVGNRGIGKSFWTHALTNPDIRSRLAVIYGKPGLERTQVEIGFNASTKMVGYLTPTQDGLDDLLNRQHVAPERIWRAVLLRMAQSGLGRPHGRSPDWKEEIQQLDAQPLLFSQTLSELDDQLQAQEHTLLIVFDALDRLGKDWPTTGRLTGALLRLALELQSFSAIRTKIFMRVDQFSDEALFRFPDGSKIRNDYVSLAWQPSELYGLLLFEVLRAGDHARTALQTIAADVHAQAALPMDGADPRALIEDQQRLIHALAGPFMGSGKKRGQVYTWLPTHLSDAAQACSPRTFLAAWGEAARHPPAPAMQAVDHLGLFEGVRKASRFRLEELYEDYAWVKPALEALRRQQVPMLKQDLFAIWTEHDVIGQIRAAGQQTQQVPVRLADSHDPGVLLDALKTVAVMEERSNGKINVPDIFRVEAQILRKGGVSVPKRGRS